MKCVICDNVLKRKTKYSTCSEKCTKKHKYLNNINGYRDARLKSNQKGIKRFEIKKNLVLGQILCACVYCGDLFTNPTGHVASCPGCKKFHSRIIRNTPEKIEIDKNARKNWRIKNREKLNNLQKEYIKKNPNKKKQYQKKWIKKIGGFHNYRKKCPTRYIGHLLRLRLYMAFNQKNIPKRCASKEYGIDFLPIIKYLKETLPSDYERGKYHIDHIKPICSFDFTKKEEIKKAFALENHQWLLAKENLIKGGKY